ncbi:hypothetical protein D0Y65_048085 [Glycine soja]|uniref:Reverse transcriptase zinc-binding domain-containing protein n=1 Tax=Glycine soja TaxID=3848 RepID=A0A445FRK0_GLYSO|nr:hypothetical protein D0Y65_048085 [Glycine soja]
MLLVWEGQNKALKGGVSVVLWVLWCHRNNILFKQEMLDFDKVTEFIKFKAWSWLNAKVNNFKSSFFDWYVNPSICIKIA